MALLNKDSKQGWVFGGRNGSKHRGKTLEKVAEVDPSYLTFMWTNSLKYLSEPAIDALDDLMDEKKIPREFPRKKKEKKTK